MKRHLAVLAIATLPLVAGLMTAEPADARAGGGSYSSSTSSSSGHSSHSYSSHSSDYYSGPRDRYGNLRDRSEGDGRIPWLAYAIFGGWVGICLFVRTKGVPKAVGEPTSARDVTHLVPRAAERDPVWQEAHVLGQASDAFMAVQRAWMKRDQEVAKHVMTPALYDRHRAQTDAMRARGEVNTLESLTIRKARLVGLADHLDDTRDQVWIKFVAETIDYTVDERTGAVIKGDREKMGFFSEVWLFRRQGDAWLADEILASNARLPASFVEA